MTEPVEHRRPNIVIFMTDQQRGSTVLPGDPLKAHTPHLDELRRDGVTFSQCFTVAPHCCPSRASLFTGRYPTEHGVWNNVNVANALSRGPRPGVPFWSQQLSAAGYQLGFAGKWHVSNTTNPKDYGWRECLVTSPGSSDPHAPEELQRELARSKELSRLKSRTDVEDRVDGEIVRPGYPRYVHYGTNEDPFRDAEVVRSATQFLERVGDHDEPWVMYVGTLGPHDPYFPPQKFLDQYPIDSISLPASFHDPMLDKPGLYRRTRERFDQLTEREHREALRHYLALCSYEDELFGQIHDTVTRIGALDNTIFIYLSDHGDYAGDHGLWCKGLPSFQSAVHIPLIIGGTGLKDARRGTVVDSLTSIVDIAPTVLSLCDQSTEGLPGRSLTSDLRGEPSAPREEIILQTNGNEAYGIQRTIVTDRWKLVVNYFDHDELYDRQNDPEEQTNLLHRQDTRRTLGAGPLDAVPESLRPLTEDLYRRLWSFGLEYDDELTGAYIMTALGNYGPMIAGPS